MNEVARVVIEGVLCDAVTDSVTEATGKIPFNWLKQAVSKGLTALVLLHLDGGPASETVTQTAAIWYRVLKG